MSAGIYDIIPGLKEAQEEYKTTQIEAFAGIEPRICGMIEVLPFTPQMFVELDMCGNRFFVSDEGPDENDAAALLWRVSPLYARNAEEFRHGFTTGLTLVFLEVDAFDIIAGIQSYIARAWAGMPLFSSKSGGYGSDVSTWSSHIVHIIAKEYGWTEEYILNLPFRRLWQYANRIMEDINPKYKERCGRAMQIRQNWLLNQTNN